MDLLGTARTPLASEEDIERADLEVFKAKSLREFENIGKVSSSNLESVSRIAFVLDAHLAICALISTSIVLNMPGRL